MKRGSLLTFVLVFVLAVSILVSAMLRLSFGYKQSIARQGAAVSALFSAESAILAYLEGFPSGYFKELPTVEVENFGPWLQIKALRECSLTCAKFFGVKGFDFGYVKVLVGKRFEGAHPRFDDWLSGTLAYRDWLRKRVVDEKGLEKYSGNKRFFSIAARMVLSIDAGDCMLDMVGHNTLVSVFVDGNATLKGTFQTDTLRIFANGDVNISGGVSAKWVEIYSGGAVRISENVELRGVVWGREEVSFAGNSLAGFPSVVLALGNSLASVALRGHSRVEGVLAAPTARIDVENTAVWDSAGALLPFFLPGENVAFEQNFEK